MKKILIGMLLLAMIIPALSMAAPQAQQAESTISGFMDTDGLPIAVGTVEYFTSDSLSSYKDVYADAQKSAILSQPIALYHS